MRRRTRVPSVSLRCHSPGTRCVLSRAIVYSPFGADAFARRAADHVRRATCAGSRRLTKQSDAEAVGVSRPSPQDWDEAKTRILASNTAQGVHKHLRNLESNRSRVLPRWIWELLQNARDVADGNGSLVASVEICNGELTFRHNGRGFEPDEITHLVYYGSTKLELDNPIGQFGSGFLTTHLLSPTIEVAGQLTDGRTFAFQLDRSGESVADLQHGMDTSFEAFKSSLAPANDGGDPGTTTTFRYPIDERASKAVHQGMHAVELAGPYVTVFNHEFKRIQFLTQDSGIVFELQKRRELAEHISEVNVDISTLNGGPPEHRSHVVAETSGVAVAIPFERQGEDVFLKSPKSVPKLLLGFPLIGTEDFSFPAVAYSLRFSPTEERDGVYLGQSDDKANQENQAVLEQAFRLLLLIAQFAAKSGWSRIHVLAAVPPIYAQSWLNEDWLRDCLRTHLVEPLRATASVLTEAGAVVAPNASTLPVADSPEAVDQLWSLAYALTSLRDTLPRQAEAQGWCSAAQMWADLYDCSLEEFQETMDGRDLAGHAESAGSIEALQAQLEDGDAKAWLDDLHCFLSANDLDDALRSLKIVPDQNGRFGALPQLHRDRDIPEELKEIAQLIGWDLRAELRDTLFCTLAEEPGAGDIESDVVIPKLIERLRQRMEKSLDDASKSANVRLFAWLASHGQWRHLDGFPAFSSGGESSTLIKLIQQEDVASERPLAPVTTWPKPLRKYADLFPRRRTLADDFAAGLDGSNVWSALDERGLLRTSVLYTRAVPLSFDDFLPNEPLPEDVEGKVEHRTEGTVEITDVAFLSGGDIAILSRVRQSRILAQLFWDFLTCWLAVEDVQGLEIQESACVCGSPHHYYPAAWLVPLANNQWVPLEGRRADRATANSLANLVRDSQWPVDLLRKSPQVIAFLKALGVSIPELIIELVTTDHDERAALDETLARLLTSVGSDWGRLQVLAEDIHEDGDLFDHLEDRRQRRRMVRENQRLGALVEELVRESLEDEGFDVRRTGVGSDFAIQPRQTAEDDQVRLELTRGGRTWLVEIKSARDDSVRMTAVQARTSVEHDLDYLLCVVPISSGPQDPNIEAVRRGMRFVIGIGARLVGICDDLDSFESLRDTVTSEDAPGLRLELDAGSPRIRIGSTVWEAGFGLEHLFSRLTTMQGGCDDANDQKGTGTI